MLLKNRYIQTMPSENNTSCALEVPSMKNCVSGACNTLTDDQEKAQLVEEYNQERIKAQMIKRISSNKQEFLKLLEKTLEMVVRLLNLCDKDEVLRDSKDEVFRIVHTIKGNFSIFYVMDVVNHIHDYEALLKDITQEDLEPNLIRDFICVLDHSLNQFINNHKKLFGTNDWKKSVYSRLVGNAKFARLNRELIERDLSDRQSETRKEKNTSERPSEVFSFLNDDIFEHAMRLGKEVNKLKINDNRLRLKTSFLCDFKFYLIHLLRNSIDHGIELPCVREDSGKQRAGNIELTFEKVGGDLSITFRDDGRGIDSAALLRRAKMMKLDLNSQQSENPLLLAFYPGLSSAKFLSRTSGRGVGLDAVREFIKGIGGQINVTTNIGEYCCFKIKVFNFFS